METLKYLKGIEKLLRDDWLFRQVAERFAVEIRTFPAAIKHHHAEVGGYARHIWETMTFCVGLSESIASVDGLDRSSFGMYDMGVLMRLAFLHDIDKLTRYELDPEEPTAAQVKYAKQLGCNITTNDCKSSLSTKIDNMKNGVHNPIQYYRYKDQLALEETARVVMLCAELDIVLTEEQIHCICYHHGGWSGIANRDMSPMACVLHCADLMSAKVLG